MTTQLIGRSPYERRQLVITARASELSDVRRHVRDSVTADLSIETMGESVARWIADLELVASELATNVIQHAQLAEIAVAVQRVGDAWIIEVDGADALTMADAVAPARPPDVEPSGRGLLIVHALTDSVEIVERDGGRLIRCLKRIC
jgi:anti-sigma regulatory factor (Ser/Thr protein kinase)